METHRRFFKALFSCKEEKSSLPLFPKKLVKIIAQAITKRTVCEDMRKIAISISMFIFGKSPLNLET